jgi:hypothetical protein
MSNIKLTVNGNVVYDSNLVADANSNSLPLAEQNEVNKYVKVKAPIKDKEYYYISHQKQDEISGDYTNVYKQSKYTGKNKYKEVGHNEFDLQYIMEDNSKPETLFIQDNRGGGGASHQIPKTKTPRQKIQKTKPSPLNHLFRFSNINDLAKNTHTLLKQAATVPNTTEYGPKTPHHISPSMEIDYQSAVPNVCKVACILSHDSAISTKIPLESQQKRLTFS